MGVRWLVVELASGETLGSRPTAGEAADLFLDLTREGGDPVAVIPVDDDGRAINDVGVVIRYDASAAGEDE